MKITATHFEILRAAISALDTPENRQQYLDGKFSNSDKVRDLDTRYRFDLFHFAQLGGRFSTSYMRELYHYLNDDHIATALGKIVPTLGVVGVPSFSKAQPK